MDPRKAKPSGGFQSSPIMQPSRAIRFAAWSFILSVVTKAYGLSSPKPITIPSWSDLERQLQSRQSSPHPRTTATLAIEGAASRNTTTLYRERNGWCVYSARLWIALELKGVQFDTVLLDNSDQDTYDGGSVDDESLGSEFGTEWPERLEGRSLPALIVGKDLLCGATEASSLTTLEALDRLFPDATPLWQLTPKDGDGIRAEDVARAARTFGELTAKHLGAARPSPRAAWLFRGDEGYRLDPLPRSSFEGFLDGAESLLLASRRGVDGRGEVRTTSTGPFLCGSSAPSAADVVWAPLLERYAAQLPCLHADLRPRGSADRRWPLLDEWYDAMDGVPAYACRIKGDAPSWRKVLSVDPWWPRPDLWHSRDSVGPKGELLLSEEDCAAAFGGSAVSDELWTEYASSSSSLLRGVCPRGPAAEASALVIRNRDALSQDAEGWIEDNLYCGGNDLERIDVDLALRAIAMMLAHEDSNSDNTKINQGALRDIASVEELLIYLDDRICVPRDMGAPSAAAIRKLCRERANL